jgi:hypothetical protein
VADRSYRSYSLGSQQTLELDLAVGRNVGDVADDVWPAVECRGRLPLFAFIEKRDGSRLRDEVLPASCWRSSRGMKSSKRMRDRGAWV